MRSDLVAAVDDAVTRSRVEAERRCVALVGGGCLAPVAAYHDGRRLTGLVAAEDGSWVERRTGDDPAAIAAALIEASSGAVTKPAHNRHDRVSPSAIPFVSPWEGGG